MISYANKRVRGGDIVENFLLASIMSRNKLHFLQNDIVMRFNILRLYNNSDGYYTLSAQTVSDSIAKIDENLRDRVGPIISQMEEEEIIISSIGKQGGEVYTLSAKGIAMIPQF